MEHNKSYACEKKCTKKVAYPIFSLYLCTRNEIEVGFCEIPDRLSKAVFQLCCLLLLTGSNFRVFQKMRGRKAIVSILLPFSFTAISRKTAFSAYFIHYTYFIFSNLHGLKPLSESRLFTQHEKSYSRSRAFTS